MSLLVFLMAHVCVYFSNDYYANHLCQERRVKEIVLKAMGQAINKTVAIAEILKVATI